MKLSKKQIIIIAVCSLLVLALVATVVVFGMRHWENDAQKAETASNIETSTIEETTEEDSSFVSNKTALDEPTTEPVSDETSNKNAETPKLSSPNATNLEKPTKPQVKPTHKPENVPDNSKIPTEDVGNSKFFGEWKANVIVGLSNDSYEYGVENLTLSPDGQAIYKNFKGHWKFQKEVNLIKMSGKVSSGGVSVETEIVLKVIEKDGVTILHLDDSDDTFDKYFYPSAVFVQCNSIY